MKNYMALIFACLCFVVMHVEASLGKSPPNIILLMPDDMDYGELAVHGNPIIQTPHLDKLHAGSFRFTDFHVSSTCAPSRAGILTGRHEFMNGVTHTIWERERMALDATILPEVLKTAGYTTGIFGKWHLGDEKPYMPGSRGFDEVFIHGGGGLGQTYPGSCGDFPGNTYFDPVLLHNDELVKTEGFCTDSFFDQTEKWIKSCADQNKRFFAYIPLNAPHYPFISPGPKYTKMYEGKKLNGKKITDRVVGCYAMITHLDERIGRLLEKLQEWGLEEDTLIICMGDSGGNFTRYFNVGTRGGKSSQYYGGTHTYAFWRWPGVLKPQDCPTLAAHSDILPTLMEIANINPDDKLSAQIEGDSLVPLLKDPAADWNDRIFVTHRGRWPNFEADKYKYIGCAIRNQRYQLVDNTELYDLEKDLAQETNIIDQHPDIAATLRKDYEAWWTKVRPMMINEEVIGPEVNPFKAMYWERFGGEPTPAMLKKMNPRQKKPGSGAQRKKNKK